VNEQDITAVLERVIGPLENEVGSWDDVLRRAAGPRAEGWDDVLHPAGAQHPRRRRTFPRWRIVAVAAVVLLGGLLVTPAFSIASSLLDLLKGDGQPPIRLTAVEPPSWLPDGKIVFASRRPLHVFTTTKGDHYELYVMNADGSEKQALLVPGDGPFSWSPDGRKIAFARRHNGSSQVYVMNADGSGVRRLTSRPRPRAGGSWNVFAGGWSPDGRKLALAAWGPRNVEIYVMNADGSGQRRLTRAAMFDHVAPAWSPDGRKIAFAKVRSGNSEVFVMNADGSAKRRLTRQPAGGHSPAWSPDGRKILFGSGRDGNQEIYAMNADGSGQRNLTREQGDDYAGAWSPDGRKISFVTKRDGNWEVYVMNPDGSGKRNLTRNPGNDGPRGWGAAWSPDGRKIAFVSDRDRTYEVYVMNADGSGQRRLTHRGS
jgi:dipeptidyl aminopeptidase/acylaminoacyl peptidase